MTINRIQKNKCSSYFRFLITGLLLFAITNFVSAQIDMEELVEIQANYPEENYIELDNHVRIELDLVNNDFVGVMYMKKRYLFLNKKMSFFQESLYSRWNSKLLDFEINVYTPEKNRYKKREIKDFEEAKTPYGYIFYDDLKQYNFSFTDIKEGTIIEIGCEKLISDPKMLGIFYLNSSLPMVDFYVELITDENIDISFYDKNIDTSIILQSYTQKNNTIYRKWYGKNVPPYTKEDNQPGYNYFVPHIVPIINSYTTKKGVSNVLGSEKDLYNWYYSLIDSLDVGIDNSALQAIADSLCRGCSTDIEKVSRMYRWVQENITYIAFEYATDGFIPTKADQTLKNRYGDCKDKSVLLQYLLKLCSVETYLTWIGTRNKPYSYYEIASPHTDNHMILTYIEGGKHYFLDPTGKSLPMEMPSSFIQGKEALISKGENEFDIQTVPTIPSSVNQVFDSLFITINKATIQGNGKCLLKGYPKISFQNKLLWAKEPKLKEQVSNRIQKGNNKFLLSEYTLPPLDGYDMQMPITYVCTIHDYIKVLGDEIYVNLNLTTEMENQRIEQNRENPYAFDNCISYHFYNQLTIPDGYKLEYVPDNSFYWNKDFGFDVKYDYDEDQISYTISINVDLLMIKKEQFVEWNKLIDELCKTYSETIILKKI